MTSNDYPALYRSSDELSIRFQRIFYRVIGCHLGFLVLAALIATVDSSDPNLAIGQSLILLVALACSIYLAAARPDRHWYASRAVAESIKTATWRFVARAEPFDGTTGEDRDRFRNILKAIVDQNRDVTKRLTTYLDGVQITDAMLAIRESNLASRRMQYLELRIRDQFHWYARKAAFNRRMSKAFFIALIVTNGIAITISIARVRYTAIYPGLPDVFIALAASLLAWLQSKRFSEHAASYALAAHEISLINEQSSTIQQEGQFSRFVGDTENAFSREHTQWVARKDE